MLDSSGIVTNEFISVFLPSLVTLSEEFELTSELPLDIDFPMLNNATSIFVYGSITRYISLIVVWYYPLT
jgi:hypothetical protein